MKVIVLDIDGVLVNRDWYIAGGERAKAAPECVRALNRIIDATGASIVVSTSRRRNKSFAEVVDMIYSYGVIGEVVGMTPVLDVQNIRVYGAVSRETEIRAWLDSHGWPEAFVILDDDNDVGFPDRHVRTKFDAGLTEADADRAIEILGRCSVYSAVLHNAEAF